MDKEQIPDLLQIKSPSLSRRSLLQGAACAGGAATILAVTANRAAAAKMKQSAVGYVGSSSKSGQNCANCAVFQPPSGCKIVEGSVSPQGWCKVWQRKPA
jgi:hypothetical protein